MTCPWPDDVIRPRWPSTIIVSERALQDAENLGWHLSCAERTAYGKYFELILTVNMETGHPVPRVHLEINFRRSVITAELSFMTAWNRKTWKFCEQFLRFGEKRTLMVKFSKLCSESSHGDVHRLMYERLCIWSPPVSVPRSHGAIEIVLYLFCIVYCCVQCRKICPTGNRWNRALLTSQKKFRFPLKLSLYCADRAQNLSWPAPNIWLTMFQISSKSVHFRWCYSRRREYRFSPFTW